MERVTLAWVVQQVESINFLDRITLETDNEELGTRLRIARAAIEEFFANSIYRPYVKVSLGKANQLAGTIDGLLEKLEADTPSIEPLDKYLLDNQFRALKTVFLSELAVFPTFLVAPKDVYDIDRLIDNGAMLFPISILKKVPEGVVDAEEAGKCLAFERNTACGFHVFRVVESVLRRYWDKVTEQQTKPHPNTLGNLTAQLEQLGKGDAKVLESLKQLAKLHRNPLAHPDVSLSSDEAIALLGMARSVVTPMLAELPELEQTNINQMVVRTTA